MRLVNGLHITLKAAALSVAAAASLLPSDPAAARALLDLLASPEADGPLKAAGLERPSTH
jgi:hypothetical protein